eukprot:1158756-Pelagomonas_calceolata.AAC.20
MPAIAILCSGTALAQGGLQQCPHACRTNMSQSEQCVGACMPCPVHVHRTLSRHHLYSAQEPSVQTALLSIAPFVPSAP